VHESIRLGCAALDEYSFPSGHTMHAAAFTLVAVAWFPALLAVLGVFTMLTGLARVVLGLHYPTDVALGALFGCILGLGSILLAGF
jgi:undecaprenyl-diphosphatase